ncbi:MAG: hypothetical protein K5851_01885 [Lachnospiraceae bacterium]|nr:hypothetical protein [Lachnospiraceae bacterium]
MRKRICTAINRNNQLDMEEELKKHTDSIIRKKKFDFESYYSVSPESIEVSFRMPEGEIEHLSYNWKNTIDDVNVWELSSEDRRRCDAEKIDVNVIEIMSVF